jgi:hypothetical protein
MQVGSEDEMSPEIVALWFAVSDHMTILGIKLNINPLVPEKKKFLDFDEIFRADVPSWSKSLYFGRFSIFVPVS